MIKKLYQTSFFRKINLNFENQTLFLEVEENPIIEKLDINGIKKQSLVEFIKGKMQIAEMKSFDEDLLSSDINLIYNYKGVKIKAFRNEAGWNSVYVAGKIIEKIGPILAIKSKDFNADLYVAEKIN